MAYVHAYANAYMKVRQRCGGHW